MVSELSISSKSATSSARVCGQTCRLLWALMCLVRRWLGCGVGPGRLHPHQPQTLLVGVEVVRLQLQLHDLELGPEHPTRRGKTQHGCKDKIRNRCEEAKNLALTAILSDKEMPCILPLLGLNSDGKLDAARRGSLSHEKFGSNTRVASGTL